MDTRHTHVGVKATLAVLLLLAACSNNKAAAPARTTTTTTTATSTTTTAPPTTPPPTTPPTNAPGTCPPPPPRNEPRADRSRYSLTINVSPADNAVTGRVEVVFQPDLPTDRLVFRLWANGPRPAKAGAKLDVGVVQVDGQPAPSERPDATTLVVPWPGGVAVGQKITAAVDFHLTLPRPVDDRISRTGDAIRLGSFFPILSWEPGVGWATEPPTSGFAEASMAPTADFTAAITVPPGFDVLAAGVPDNAGRWTATAVEDFAFSVGHFKTATAMVGATKVTVGVDTQLTEAPEPYLRRVVDTLTDFNGRYGPYPWPAYTLAVGPNLRGGIEYPMHVMQGPKTVGRTTPHEVAHQWFYGLVQSNQGRNPWMDEGLASWAEARHEDVLAIFVARPIPAAAKGQAGQPMSFWESRQTAYYRGVYVQPVQALAALGPPDLVDCALRVYVARNAYRVAKPADLIDALRTVFPDVAATLARFGINA